MNRKQIFILVYRIIFALVGWFGVIGHFYQRAINRPPGWSLLITFLDFLKYYTIQTNLFVVIWLTLAVIFWRRRKVNSLLEPKIKGALTVYISVTFIVYALLLAKLWNPQGLDRYTTVVSHYVTPIAFTLDWFYKDGSDLLRGHSCAKQGLFHPLDAGGPAFRIT